MTQKSPTKMLPQKRQREILGEFESKELKFFDAWVKDGTLSATVNATNGEQDPTLGSCLNAVLQGTDPWDRDGRKILIKHIKVLGVFESEGLQDQADVHSQSMFLVAIVLDKQTNGTQLSSELVYQNPAAHSRMSAMPLRNMNYLSRFEILQTALLMAPTASTGVDGSNSTTISGYQIPFELNMKTNIRVEYITGAGGIADISNSSIHVLAWCTSTSMAPAISYNSRIRFYG